MDPLFNRLVHVIVIAHVMVSPDNLEISGATSGRAVSGAIVGSVVEVIESGIYIGMVITSRGRALGQRRIILALDDARRACVFITVELGFGLFRNGFGQAVVVMGLNKQVILVADFLVTVGRTALCGSRVGKWGNGEMRREKGKRENMFEGRKKERQNEVCTICLLLSSFQTHMVCSD